MIFSWLGKSKIPDLKGNGLFLRALKVSDYSEWQKVRSKSKDFLTPFEPRWREDELSKNAFLKRVRHNNLQASKKAEFSFTIWQNDDGLQKLVGGVTISNIRYYSGHANIGYWMSVDSANKGIMSNAVALLLSFAFDELKLVRMHAATLPNNIPSRKVLTNNGFWEEGYAVDFLSIDGKFCNHILYALTLRRYRDVGNR